MVTKSLFQKIAVSFMILLISLPFADICAQSNRGSTEWNNAVRSTRERRSRSIRNQQFFDELWRPKNDKQIKNKDEEQKNVSEKATQSNAGANSDSVKTKTQIGISDANQNKEKNVELVVTGDGNTKENAVQAALRSAIEQAFGTFVSSNTQILNDELVKDEIATVTTGNIKKYQILTETNVDGRYLVSLRAVVSVDKLIDYVKQKGGSTELAGNLFVTNYKLQKLNQENMLKARKNLIFQMKQILPTIFDFELVANSPKEGRYELSGPNSAYSYGHQYQLAVPVKLNVKVNKNADAIRKILNTTLGINENGTLVSMRNGNYSELAKYLLEQVLKFEIDDGVHKYSLTCDTKRPTTPYGNISMKYILVEMEANIPRRSVSKKWYYSKNLYFYDEYYFNFYDGYEEYSLQHLLLNSENPTDYMFTFEFDIFYTLSDLEKVREITVSIPSKN